MEKHILAQLDELEQWMKELDTRNPAVSKTTIGWQIGHTLKVANGIIKMISRADPALYKWKFNTARMIVFTLNHIPRGKGKAPKEAIPDPEEFTKEGLEELFEKVRTRLEPVVKLPATAHFKHPFFGVLNKKKSLQFIKIHNDHHLKIIRDIVKK